MKKNIEGVIVTPLKIISDDRGSVMHMLRNDSKNFVSLKQHLERTSQNLVMRIAWQDLVKFCIFYRVLGLLVIC